MATIDAERLAGLWREALAGRPAELERTLAEESRLPGPRSNLELAHQFADLAGTTGAADRDAASALLGGWLARPPVFATEIAEGQAEFLPAVAALASGAVMAADARAAAARADRGVPLSTTETAALTTAASDDRWRVRELAATGLQRVLAADWSLGLAQARRWLRSDDPLLARAAAAAVAEPPLLRDPDHARDARVLVEEATDLLLAEPESRRRDPDVRTLRQALGYAVSVVAVADLGGGIPLLERLATSADPDARWIARENLKKSRLAPLADRLETVRAAAAQR